MNSGLIYSGGSGNHTKVTSNMKNSRTDSTKRTNPDTVAGNVSGGVSSDRNVTFHDEYNPQKIKRP